MYSRGLLFSHRLSPNNSHHRRQHKFELVYRLFKFPPNFQRSEKQKKTVSGSNGYPEKKKENYLS